HMNGRIYDPQIGRFLSADTIIQAPADLQFYNRYSYVRNNPLRYTDPTGYESEERQYLTRKREKEIEREIFRQRFESGEGLRSILADPVTVRITSSGADSSSSSSKTPDEDSSDTEKVSDELIDEVNINESASGTSSKETQKADSLNGTMHLLVGGPYTDSGITRRAGHFALGLSIGDREYVWDFGRYADVWGSGGSKGDGILRVWPNIEKYIEYQSTQLGEGRQTSNYQLGITEEDAHALISFFADKTSGTSPYKDPVRDLAPWGDPDHFKLPSDYDAVKNNCCTLGLEGASIGSSLIDPSRRQFINGSGMESIEVLSQGLFVEPNGIFMPLDVQLMLDYMIKFEAAPMTKTVYP
ncbi:MAG: RHS repeat-associated core domain-containing protein, partial [Allomuricauda sp.]